MNRQGKVIDEKVVGGIEWTKTVRPDGTEYPGYTWNPIAGCFHACQWTMPDGSVANCYAEDVADGVAGAAYPEGFEHHYWKPKLLVQPARVSTPSRIFVGSMADVFGHWVPEDHIHEVLDVARACPQHTFQFLTKNPLRVLNEFASLIPPNCWIGASTPPDFMWNKPLTEKQRARMLRSTIQTLAHLQDYAVTTWLSAEPITIDAAAQLEVCHYTVVNWVVIGAASKGRMHYPPNEAYVRSLVAWCDDVGARVFFKGNLRSLTWAAANWREDFPKAGSA
jgi:Bacteriophage protein gp37